MEVYFRLASEITEADERKTIEIMAHHVGEENAIPLGELAQKVLGKVNDNTKRQMRIILERLVDSYRIPICANSGKAGRWIGTTNSQVEHTAVELISRGNADHKRARSLRKAKLPHELAAEYMAMDNVAPVQGTLFEMPAVRYWG